MLARVLSYGLIGIEGYPVTVEADISQGMPMYETVGLPDAAVRESRERVRAALRNSGYIFPVQRVTVNLAPADIKKEGPIYDLPIALGLMAASGQLPLEKLTQTVVLGELSLDGELRPVSGALPIILAAKEAGYKAVLLPKGNAGEGTCVDGIEVFAADTLKAAVKHITGEVMIQRTHPVPYIPNTHTDAAWDIALVRGQSAAKRALEIAAAGGHDILLIGSPGAGKTMLARCLPGILPDMTMQEAVETTRVHSVAGLLESGGGLLRERPFRAPHHTASAPALIGGGAKALPGEISRAHNGVLFLDELPEFQRGVLETLRQPMENGFVTVSRVGAQVTYPSRFMMVCAMNPCPCGYYGSRERECHCTPLQIKRYLHRVSGPLLDRIDLHIEMESIPAEQFMDEAPAGESCEKVRERVSQARQRQLDRFGGMNIYANSQLGARELEAGGMLTAGAKDFLREAARVMAFSTRALTRVIKVARTIADLSGEELALDAHVAEAIQYRALDQKFWNP